MCVQGICIYLEKPEVEIYRKLICIFCVIEMSGTMLGSMPEVQQVEMPLLTKDRQQQLSARQQMFVFQPVKDLRDRLRT